MCIIPNVLDLFLGVSSKKSENTISECFSSLESLITLKGYSKTPDDLCFYSSYVYKRKNTLILHQISLLLFLLGNIINNMKRFLPPINKFGLSYYELKFKLNKLICS